MATLRLLVIVGGLMENAESLPPDKYYCTGL